MQKGDKVAVGWCDPGEVDGNFAADMFMLAGSRRRELDMVLRVEGSALISRSRNELVRRFLEESTAAWLWMVDSDHSFSVHDFDRLCQAADRTNAPVMAGVYFGGWRADLWITPIPMIFRKTDSLPTFEPVWDYPPDRVVEVDAAGTGCLLVHRDVLRAMRETADASIADWCWFADGPSNGRWVGEDMVFCDRVRAAGFKVHAHTGVQLLHRKSMWLGQKQYAWLVSQLPKDGR